MRSSVEPPDYFRSECFNARRRMTLISFETYMNFATMKLQCGDSERSDGFEGSMHSIVAFPSHRSDTSRTRAIHAVASARGLSRRSIREHDVTSSLPDQVIAEA